MNVNHPEILPVLEEYTELYREKKEIMKEIHRVRHLYKKRLDAIRQRQDVLDKVIVEFCQRNHHEKGVRYKDIIFSPETQAKKKVTKQQRKETIREVLSTNGLHPESKIWRDLMQLDDTPIFHPVCKVKIKE